MNTILIKLLLCTTAWLTCLTAPAVPPDNPGGKDDPVSQLVQLLDQLRTSTDQPLLEMHFSSLKTMILDTTHAVSWSSEDTLRAAEVLEFMQNGGSHWETYANGPRPLMVSFKSPSDGKNTYYWLFLPGNFNPDVDDYPFYLELHGSGGGKNDNPRNMLFNPLRPQIKGVTAQGYRQEGFFIYPWGRGDQWYRGQAETDIEECLQHFDNLFKTDPQRQFLYGFSMGGSGVFDLAQKTSERWTGIGIYSGAFRDGVTLDAAIKLDQLPVWITWGETERLAENNRKLKDILLQNGNEVRWAEVEGVGHSYLGEYQEDLMDWFVRVSAGEKGFVSIFDGESFDGWVGDDPYWSVKNGAIHGEITPETIIDRNRFLIYQGDIPADFELKLEYRISEKGNSGINYRSEVVEGINYYALAGYQFDLDGAKNLTGSNYEERNRSTLASIGEVTELPTVEGSRSLEPRVKNYWTARVVTDTLGTRTQLTAHIRDGQWNEVHLIVRGYHMQHFVNGVLMSEVRDQDTINRRKDGLLGVQVHIGPPMTIEYKNIRIKDLTK